MKLYFMYNVIPRDFDREIVASIVKRFYGKWINVSQTPYKYSYNIVIRKCSDNPVLIDPSTIEMCVERIGEKHVLRAIEYGKAYLRLAVTWFHETYSLSMNGEQLENYDIHPAYDILIWRRGYEENILIEKGLDPGSNPLLLKKFGGEHLIYSGPRVYGKMIVPDEGCNIQYYVLGDKRIDNDLDKFLEHNRMYLLHHVAIARKFLESLGEPDIVVTSFSGGKDSLVTLDLALKHYGRDMVKAIYVDTGVDFPETSVYVDRVMEKLGVEIVKAYAPVKEHIGSKGLPIRANRWCTIYKTIAFKKQLMSIRDRYKKTLVLVGDRDVESYARSRKPPIRRREGYLEASPLKQWATIHVQLYTWLNKLPENPLYLHGFYRLGCYICPALTGLEKQIMLNKLYESLRNREWFVEFMNNSCKEGA